jgi:hypothetical protein
VVLLFGAVGEAVEEWFPVSGLVNLGSDFLMAAALRGNKSSRVHPRPGGAYLRRQRRACGGGAPGVDLLYRRYLLTTPHPSYDVSLLAVCPGMETQCGLYGK